MQILEIQSQSLLLLINANYYTTDGLWATIYQLASVRTKSNQWPMSTIETSQSFFIQFQWSVTLWYVFHIVICIEYYIHTWQCYTNYANCVWSFVLSTDERQTVHTKCRNLHIHYILSTIQALKYYNMYLLCYFTCKSTCTRK